LKRVRNGREKRRDEMGMLREGRRRKERESDEDFMVKFVERQRGVVSFVEFPMRGW
jgi:hypothetical protein